MDDKVLRPVVKLAAKVALQDGLGTISVALLGVERSTRHVRDHGIATTEGVLGIAERMVLGGGLGEPDITTVSAEVTSLESLGNVLLDDDGATGGVDEP